MPMYGKSNSMPMKKGSAKLGSSNKKGVMGADSVFPDAIVKRAS